MSLLRQTSMQAVALVLIAGGSRAQQPNTRLIVAENPLAIERRDEIVTVPWKDVLLSVPNAHDVRVRDASGHEMVSQIVDNDADGKPDELIFLSDFWPKETKNF